MSKLVVRIANSTYAHVKTRMQRKNNALNAVKLFKK